MDSRELRIGNWVYEKGRKEFRIDADYLCDFANGFYKFHPVKLTEEWLIKFGFSVREGGYAHLNLHNKGAYIYINHSGSGIAIENDETELSYQIELKYVHQVQNLFYSLTNIEL